MIAWRAVAALVRADLRERTRRHSFLVTLGLTAWVSYLLVPPPDAGYSVMDLAGYRGLYNSAWVGTMVAVWTAMFLSMAGFFLVKNAVALDRRSGVGEILATTNLGRFAYVAGKALANFVYLAVMVLLVAVTAGVMQLLRGESTGLEPWELAAPFLFLTLPAMALVAAFAVLFESVRFLRGTAGNVVYLAVVWQAMLMAGGLSGGLIEGEIVAGSVDPLGWTAPIADMLASCRAAIPECTGLGNVGINPIDEPLGVFLWLGMAWTPEVVGVRLLWLLPALLLVVAAALCFDRFDPSAERPEKRRTASAEIPPPLPAAIERRPPSPEDVRYPPLGADAVARHPLLGLCREELRLVFRERGRWWLLVAASLVVAGVLAPLAVSHRYLLGAAFVWGLPLWSGLGCRDDLHRTDQLLRSSPGPLRRQLPASWLAGVLAALVLGSGVSLRLLLAGEWLELGAVLVATLFVPSLALALGVWSRSRKPFEVVYALIWYFGPMQGLWALDFLGVWEASLDHGMPLFYLAASAMLLGAAVVGRRLRRSV